MKITVVIVVLSLGLVSFSPSVIELVKRSILNDQVEILLPKDFEIMSEEMLNIKYPSNRRPTLVFTDSTAGVNVAFNHTTSKADQQQIDAYKENFVSTFKNLYPSAVWKGSGVKQIIGKKVGYLELITPALDTKIYNLMFFTDLDGRLLLCTFNCVETKQAEWSESAQQIMNSLKIN